MSRAALLVETAWCIAVVTGGVMAVGLPVQWLLGGRRPLEEGHWARAPFVGLAAIVLSLQALVYADVPVARSAPWLWGTTALLWLWMGRGRGLRWRSAPVALLAVALLVYLVQGGGLLLAGARWYVGRAWGDQFNYTAIAEFLREERFSLSPDQVGLRPYLVVGLFSKGHRIGQSILHAFFAVSAFRDTKAMFVPTILLSPALTALAAAEVQRGLAGSLARGWALAGCAAAGALPGLALLHLEGFQSQCLALPLLLLWPVLLRDVVLDPRWPAVGALCLVLAAVTSLYPELLPIVLGLAVAGLGVAALRHPARGRLLVASLCMLATLALFTLTPAFRGLVVTAGYVGKAVLGHLYPWAFRLEGLTRIWAGDLVESGSAAWRGALHAAAVACTAGGYGGLFQALWHVVRRDEPVGGARGSAAPAFALALGLLALLPVLVLAQSREHPYQFYKLALTIAPLVALGGALIRAPRLRAPLVALMLALGAAGTFHLGWQAARPVPGPRSMAEHLMSGDARALQDALEALHDRDVVLSQREVEGRPRGVVNAWLAYFARRNRVRLGNPIVNQNFDLQKDPKAAGILDLVSTPREAVFLTSVGDPWAPVPPGARRLWSSRTEVLWQPSPGPWVTLVGVQNPNGLEEVRGRHFFWVGGGSTRLFLMAGQPGQARLSAELWMGPGGETTRRLRVQGPGGHDETLVLAQGAASLRVPLAPGIQEVRLTAPEPGRPGRPDDPRLLAIGVLGLEVAFEPAGPAVSLDRLRPQTVAWLPQ